MVLHTRTSLPDVVVFAQSVDHVSKVAQLCNKTVVPLIPFGSGTGLEGGVNALKVSTVMDTHTYIYACYLLDV